MTEKKLKPFTMSVKQERSDRKLFERCPGPWHSALRRAWTEIEALRSYAAEYRKEEKTAFRRGAEAAAGIASDYDYLSTHTVRVSDCILGKLNMRNGKPRKNKRRVVTK